MSRPKMWVMYTCHECGTNDRFVEVREREESEAVVPWMQSVQVTVGQDHKKNSPWCASEKVDLKIPLAQGSQRIGEAEATRVQ